MDKFVTVTENGRQTVNTIPSKRMLVETSPNDQQPKSTNRKVSDLNVDDLRSIIREGNKEVLDRLDYLTGDVSELKKQNMALKHEMECLKAEKDADKKRIARLEEKFKNKNLVFKGLAAGTSPVREIKKICKEILKIPDTIVLKSTRNLFDRDGFVTVLVELESEESVSTVLKNKKKLQGSKIYIEKDLNEDRQKDKKVMLRLKREILGISDLHRILVRDDKMRIAEKWFKWNENKQLVCDNKDAESVIKEIYGQKSMQINMSYEYLLNKSYPKN